MAYVADAPAASAPQSKAEWSGSTVQPPGSVTVCRSYHLSAVMKVRPRWAMAGPVLGMSTTSWARPPTVVAWVAEAATSAVSGVGGSRHAETATTAIPSTAFISLNLYSLSP